MASSRTTSDTARRAEAATTPPVGVFCSQIAGKFVLAEAAEAEEWIRNMGRTSPNWECFGTLKLLGGEAVEDLIISDITAVQSIIATMHQNLIQRLRRERGF